MLRLETPGTKTVEDFLNGSENQCESTAKEYRKRLELFAKFVQENYDSLTLDELIETLTKEGRGPRIDVYQFAINYLAWLKRRGTMTPRSIKTWVSTARHYLESMDVEISPRKWQLRVKTPKVVRSNKESLSKEDIQTILNACDSIRLKTWLLWLAATGCRATESLSVRLCDINWKTDPVTVKLRGEYTKTKASRTLLITRELADQLRAWVRYKYRVRGIGYYNRQTKKTFNKIVKPVINDQILVFSPGWRRSPTLRHLYISLLVEFEKTLERLGGRFAEYEDDNGGKHRKITPHSFRRFTKGCISDLGLEQYSEYYLGHYNSTYWTRSPKEIIELFRKCEPSLTFLDQTIMTKRHAVVESRLETMERENQRLRQKDSMNADAIAGLSDKMQELMTKVRELEKLRH